MKTDDLRFHNAILNRAQSRENLPAVRGSMPKFVTFLVTPTILAHVNGTNPVHLLAMAFSQKVGVGI